MFSFYFTLKTNLSYKAIENGAAMEENGFPLLDTYQVYKDAVKEMPLNDEGFIGSLSILVASYNVEHDAVKKEGTKKAIEGYLNRMEIRGSKFCIIYMMGIGYVIW
jgi:hypothetical protein